MSESYLNGITNSLDDYLYIDENENLSEENPTVQNGTQDNGSRENVTEENRSAENTTSTEEILNNCTLDQKIHILFSKLEFVS